MSDPIQAWFGVKLSVLIASILGGAVAAVLIGGSLIRQVINTFLGAVAAIYLGPLAIKAALSFGIGIDDDVTHALIFLSGLMGMIICEALLRMAQRVRQRANAIADKAIDRGIKW